MPGQPRCPLYIMVHCPRRPWTWGYLGIDGYIHLKFCAAFKGLLSLEQGRQLLSPTSSAACKRKRLISTPWCLCLCLFMYILVVVYACACAYSCSCLCFYPFVCFRVAVCVDICVCGCACGCLFLLLCLCFCLLILLLYVPYCQCLCVNACSYAFSCVLLFLLLCLCLLMLAPLPTPVSLWCSVSSQRLCVVFVPMLTVVSLQAVCQVHGRAPRALPSQAQGCGEGH